MNWSDIKEAVCKAAPLLGTLLGGPAGGTVGAIISSALGVENSPTAVEKELVNNPDAIVKLREVEAKRQVDLETLAVDQAKSDMTAAVQNATDVNKTMQVEAQSEHFLQFSWRPLIGYSVALAVGLSVLTVFLSYGAAIFYSRPEGLAHLPAILAAIAGIIAVVSPILGIASWFRGKQKAGIE